jgi:ABC-2 type transport system ATP-binding protein
MEIAIEARQLSKCYRSKNGDIMAVDSLDLKIPHGQLHGLIGPDGAGKTTTLRILASVVEPTNGEALVAGYDVMKEPEDVRRQIGYMPQIFSMYPDLSVRENMEFFAHIQGVPSKERESRITRLLNFSRLSQFQDRRSENLSGGMRKKLALACALVHEPRILLLDEPTTGVDPVSRRELWEILFEVVQDGVTVLVSTPYMDEAERCKAVTVLFDGQLLTSGSPSDMENELPFEVIELRSTRRRKTREVIASVDDVLAWRPVGDRIRLSVEDARKSEKRLATALKRAGVEYNILRHVKPTMDDVFIYLADEERGEE